MSSTGFQQVDEAWFIQVVHRVRSGEALYRDVFFGATPLSVWLAWGWTALFGAGLLAFKALAAVQFAGSAALAVAIGRRAGMDFPGMSILAAALLAVGWNAQASHYPGLANLCAISCLAWLLPLLDSPGQAAWGRLLAAGALAGLAFATKQTVGALTLLATLASLPGVGLGLRAAWPVLLGFLLGAVLPLLPLVWQGGMAGLWEFGFAGKGTYLRAAQPQSLGALAELRELFRPESPAGWLRKGLHSVVFVLPPLALGGWWWARRARPAMGVDLVGLFTVAALLGTLPMAGTYHLPFAMPQCLLLLAAGWMARPWAVGVAAAVATWVLLLLGGRITASALRSFHVTAHPSPLPYFLGVPVAAGQMEGIHASLTELRKLANGRPVFIVSLGASAWYLASGLRNPTPFDYPVVPGFGRFGEARVQAMILRGEVPLVAIRDDVPPAFPRTAILEPWIRARLTPLGRVGDFEVFGLPLLGSANPGSGPDPTPPRGTGPPGTH